jgi:co-chaperonin GroES (HSP10)
MKPIGKYIVITSIDEEIKTDSGIILSGEDAGQFRYKKGKVVMPGTDVLAIKEGDVIYYDKGHSFTMIIKDNQYTIIREGDVVVVE